MLNTVSNSIFSNITEYGIAIDIGTTTIAMQLIELGTMKVMDSYTALNSQRLYGADVIRRINAANHGKGEQLQKMVCNDLQQGIHTLLEKNHILEEQLQKLVIAGNTTMIHLLRQLSCETLGVYPFTPVTLERFKYQMKQSESKSGQIEITSEQGQKELGASEPNDTGFNVEGTILPGISTYIGGDIVAGLMACGFDQTEEIALFVDLGTNGEMAIGNQNRILCTSTAAGPAFEGGNISCGTGGITGAICGVKIRDGICELQTINAQAPVGICGSGLTDAVSELLNAGIIDDTGLFEDCYFEKGYLLGETASGKALYLTQKDVREFQMAKAAIRAGIEILMNRYGVACDEIKHVYLAGGLGQHINIESAVCVGLFPEELRDKITAVGNTSLQGATIELTEADAAAREERITTAAEDFPLSMEDDFNELYINYM